MTYEETLKHLMSLPLRRGLFVREYSNAGQPRAGTPPRSYLTGANAARVDAIRSKLRSWEDQHLLTMNEKALLRHDLVLAVNRVANIAGTYGHFRSSWSSSALRELVLTPSTFEAGRTAQHRIFQGPAERVADGLSADLCYLDPPYMKRQYAANYHLVETLARGDEPEAYGLSGLRDWWDQYSDFCSKRRLGDAFAAIFAKMDCGRFLVSYSEDGLFGREALMKMFSDFGSVTCYEFTNARFRSNAGGQGHRVTEYLFDLTVDRMT
jgi:adenine-specific DNA-methyltransferase